MRYHFVGNLILHIFLSKRFSRVRVRVRVRVMDERDVRVRVRVGLGLGLGLGNRDHYYNEPLVLNR